MSSISPQVFNFLKELKNNNSKDWFDAHKGQYQQVKNNLLGFTEELLKGLAQFDPDVKQVSPKDCFFRINRDVRFSADKSPYKTHLGIVVAPKGKKAPNSVYYIHLEPGSCFAGGGIYRPEPSVLSKIRQEIDYHQEDFKRILFNKHFSQTFGNLDMEDSLANAPKGYPKNHPELAYLKLKSFVAFKTFSDKIVTSSDFPVICTQTLQCIKPLNDFLNRAVS